MRITGHLIDVKFAFKACAVAGVFVAKIGAAGKSDFSVLAFGGCNVPNISNKINLPKRKDCGCR